MRCAALPYIVNCIPVSLSPSWPGLTGGRDTDRSIKQRPAQLGFLRYRRGRFQPFIAKPLLAEHRWSLKHRLRRRVRSRRIGSWPPTLQDNIDKYSTVVLCLAGGLRLGRPLVTSWRRASISPSARGPSASCSIDVSSRPPIASRRWLCV